MDDSKWVERRDYLIRCREGMVMTDHYAAALAGDYGLWLDTNIYLEVQASWGYF